MNELTIEQIAELQDSEGVLEIQKLILSGEVWKFEGSYGRQAMDFLNSGICYLPEVVTYDYYGNMIPSRNQLEAGTKGTLENAQRYWSEN